MIRLQAGELACEIEPSLGGCIAGLWLGDLPVLRSTPAARLTSSRQAGSYPLVPFSNRIAGAQLVWQGTAHPLVRNNGAELIGSTPQAFAEHNRREVERWSALIRRLGVRVD